MDDIAQRVAEFQRSNPMESQWTSTLRSVFADATPDSEAKSYYQEKQRLSYTDMQVVSALQYGTDNAVELTNELVDNLTGELRETLLMYARARVETQRFSPD